MFSNSGKQAEKVATEHRANQGHKILAKNWRTRMCEIDIVASKYYEFTSFVTEL